MGKRGYLHGITAVIPFSPYSFHLPLPLSPTHLLSLLPHLPHTVQPHRTAQQPEWLEDPICAAEGGGSAYILKMSRKKVVCVCACAHGCACGCASVHVCVHVHCSICYVNIPHMYIACIAGGGGGGTFSIGCLVAMYRTDGAFIIFWV